MLRRHVADLMPHVFSTTWTMGKKKATSNLVYTGLEGYTYKQVYKAVGKRQAQQKYLRQHLRAAEFINMAPPCEFQHIEMRVGIYYRQMKWNETDVTKVYIQNAIIVPIVFSVNCLVYVLLLDKYSYNSYVYCRCATK